MGGRSAKIHIPIQYHESLWEKLMEGNLTGWLVGWEKKCGSLFLIAMTGRRSGVANRV